MPAKFPSQTRLTYESGSLSNDTWGSAGYVNIPKDLSIVNRRGYASTSRKGTPYVYRCKFTLFAQQLDGTGYATVTDFTDNDGDGFEPTRNLYTTAKLLGVQNNWVMKNAAEKFHEARENMFKRDGMKKSDRGTYSHEIRYNFDSNSQTWISPVDGDGAAFTGGTWDLSELVTSADVAVALKLTGIGLDEDTANTATALNIGHSYLMSRRSQELDTNTGVEEGPANLSILRSLLADSEPNSLRVDNINVLVAGEQDNPPYEVLDLSDSGDVNHDITEAVELGRLISQAGAPISEVIIDVPFGIFEVQAQHFDAGDTNITSPVCYALEVIDIFEMQG